MVRWGDYEVHSVDRAFGQVDENSPSLALQPLDVSLRDDTHRDPRYFRLIRDQDLVTGNARRYETRQQFIQTRTSSRPYPKRDYQRQFWMSDWDYLNLLWQEYVGTKWGFVRSEHAGVRTWKRSLSC